MNITFSGTSRETATGESGNFSHEVTVRVAAVPTSPTPRAKLRIRTRVRTALEPGTSFTVSVNADFGSDLNDGSERHYVFVSKDYLSGLVIPAALGAAVTLLDTANAATVCARLTA